MGNQQPNLTKCWRGSTTVITPSLFKDDCTVYSEIKYLERDGIKEW